VHRLTFCLNGARCPYLHTKGVLSAI
jgi:hypothetical protein